MIRLILIFIIVFLIVRIFVIAGSGGTAVSDGERSDGDKAVKKKGVPREIGEYVDFEEIGKKS
jgi:hypothetical protein